MSKHGHTPDGTPFGGDPKATPVGVYTPAPGVEEVNTDFAFKGLELGLTGEQIVTLYQIAFTTHQQEKEALVRKLSPWLQHDATCYLYTEEGKSEDCDCGLIDAITSDNLKS